MKKLFLSTIAVLAASTVTASALEAGEVRGAYSADAFDGADEKWRRLTANRIKGCGRFGDKSKSRLDVLVDSYLAIGAALNANDDGAAVAATERLSRAININDRFESCWNGISRRNGVSSDFRKMIKKV